MYTDASCLRRVDGHLARFWRDAFQAPVISRSHRPAAPTFVWQIHIDWGRPIAYLEIDHVKAAPQDPAKRDVPRILRKTIEGNFILEERIVGHDHFTIFGALQPGRERLVAEHDMAVLLNNARHFSQGLLRLAEIIESAEVKDGIEVAVRKRQETRRGYEIFNSRKPLFVVLLKTLTCFQNHSL